MAPLVVAAAAELASEQIKGLIRLQRERTERESERNVVTSLSQQPAQNSLEQPAQAQLFLLRSSRICQQPQQQISDNLRHFLNPPLNHGRSWPSNLRLQEAGGEAPSTKRHPGHRRPQPAAGPLPTPPSEGRQCAAIRRRLQPLRRHRGGLLQGAAPSGRHPGGDHGRQRSAGEAGHQVEALQCPAGRQQGGLRWQAHRWRHQRPPQPGALCSGKRGRCVFVLGCL